MEGISKNYSSNRLIKLIYSKKSYYWEQIKKVRALKLFHEAAKRVPAYKDFLKKQNINHENIHTFNDFQNIPPVSKKNYLTQYPQKLLNWGGSISKPLVFTSTSGSTGESFYFPRQEELDWQYSILIEKFLNYGTGQGPALVIICFGMGIWIGGLITYKAFEIASRRGQYPVSIITPGINKKEIFRVLKRLAPQYNQIILVGYPPFLKDIIDEAAAEKINMKKLNIRLLFAAEPFTEKFRNYIAKTAGIKNHCLDTLNIYGTADIGAMAWETPASILIRRVATNRKKLFNELFSSASKTPTLAQYNPFFIT
ncbi:MAG: phenylacetate--CoA ligase family protein, partial [Candidatus Brennerbacteria bacterium]|nr:phenylacetate--CoA ligase family protein [Candidatus Brennerbacteria bacterium]